MEEEKPESTFHNLKFILKSEHYMLSGNFTREKIFLFTLRGVSTFATIIWSVKSVKELFRWKNYGQMLLKNLDCILSSQATRSNLNRKIFYLQCAP